MLYSGIPRRLIAELDGNLPPESVNGIMTCYSLTEHLPLHFFSWNMNSCEPEIVLTHKKDQQPDEVHQM